jgi:pimeloyl-ACP methyl ester carboxylesterase
LTHYGIKTHFVEAGEGEPIILLHGGTGTGESAWSETVPGLAGRFRAIGLDQIGFGHTDKPRIDSFQMQVDHVAGFVDAMGFERVGVVGQSTGGYVAAKYACDYPDRVFGLAMFNTSTVAHAMNIRLKEPSEGMRVMRDVDWTDRDSLKRSFDVILHNKSRITDELVDYKLAIQRLPGWTEARKARDAYRAGIDKDPNQWQLFNLVNRLPALSVPSTLIWGVEDRFAPVELGRRLHEVLPRTEYHEVANGSHHCFLDVPEVCNDLLLRFFSACLSRAGWANAPQLVGAGSPAS